MKTHASVRPPGWTITQNLCLNAEASPCDNVAFVILMSDDDVMMMMCFRNIYSQIIIYLNQRNADPATDMSYNTNTHLNEAST